MTLTELMVVILLLGFVGAITLGVLVTSTRANSYQAQLREVMDDGRFSLDRVRKELRGGRRVLAGSTAQHLYWWSDFDQDGLQQTGERIHYCVADLGTTTCKTTTETGTFQLIKWTDDEPQADADIIAQTLTTTDVFSGFASPVTATDVVTITYVLDVKSDAGPSDITMSASVRLRNVA